MDVRNIVADLPAENGVRRVIEFCASELHLPPDQIAVVLHRASVITDGLRMLSNESVVAANRPRLTHDETWERMATILNELRNAIH